MNEIKIKQEENLDVDEEKLQQPITIIKNDIRFEDLQTFSKIITWKHPSKHSLEILKSKRKHIPDKQEEEAEKYYIIRGLKENRAIEIQLQSCSNIEELKEKMQLLDIQENQNQVDASKTAIPCIPKQQKPNGNQHPIAFHSRRLRNYEINYIITELECLAIIDSLDKFHCYLHGSHFTVHTDHNA
ncbi:transposon Ty3-I Gag-Pol polyprotein [Trichonephila clavipes]|nr:transposon Ty3-I Gag-Pol polyprotein [Trichonephila clavipes]